MNTSFKNIIEFQKYFKDEETCRVYLEEDGKRFKCADKTCNKKFTVTVGTIYENSKIELQKWFLAMYIIGNHKKGISSCQLARDLGVTQKTAWFILHRLREMHREKSVIILKNQVQIDETYIGGKEGNKHANKKTKNVAGRSDEVKTPVIGFSEIDCSVRLHVVPWLTKGNIRELVEKNIEKGSIMVTDSYALYTFITKDNEYEHKIVKHSDGEYVNREGYHTNTIEGFFSLLKRGIYGIYHQVSPKHLHRYCNEFAFRYNTRKIKDVDRFDVIVKKSEGRLKYKDLTAK